MTEDIIEFLCMAVAAVLVWIFLEAGEGETAKVLSVLVVGGLLKRAGVRPGNGGRNEPK